MSQLLEKPKTHRGQPGRCVHLTESIFAVDSWTGKDWYLVDLSDDLNTCECHDFIYRVLPNRERGIQAVECKHCTQAWEMKARMNREKQTDVTHRTSTQPSVSAKPQLPPMPTSTDMEEYDKELEAMFAWEPDATAESVRVAA